MDDEDLLNLLCRRVRENREFCTDLDLLNSTGRQILSKLFPPQVDVGKRKPQTFTWIIRRIRDGNDIKPPRNLIDLVSMALQAQIRREDRESRNYSPEAPIIEADALRRALGQLSEQRVNDTLFAEAGSSAALISRFRDGKAEHNVESLAELFEVRVDQVRQTVKPLEEIGFLEYIKDTYKVPALYRSGLGITLGKAFASRVADTDDDDEE